MASFADISIRFSADLKQFSSQMQNAERDLKKVGSQFKNAGAALSIGLTAPIVALGVKGVFAFDQQAKALAQVEAGLKSTGNAANKTFAELQKGASDLQNTSLFGDEQILQDVTAQLLTFTNIAGTQFDRTQQAALDLATRLGGDLKSASIQLGKALNDPVANLSALSRSGIQFSEDQKKVINSLTKSGKLAEAQTIILDELEKQYGGAAKAAAAAGLGPFKQLGNQIGDLTEDFGKLIVEALIPFVNKVKGVVSSLQSMDDGTKKTIAIVAGLAAALGPLLVTIGFLATNVIPGLITAFAAVKTAFTALTATIAANPFGAIAVVLGIAAAAFITFYNATDKVVKQQSVLEQVSDAAARSIAGEKAKLEELLFIARDEQVSKEQRVAAIKELNALSPKYLGNLTLEKINTDEARKAIDLYNESLLRTAKVKAAQERLTDIQSKIIEAEISGSKARKNILTDEAFQNKIKADAIRKGISVEQAQKELQDALNIGSGLRIKNLNEEANALLEIIKNNDDFNASLNGSLNAGDSDGKRIKVTAVLDPKLEVSGSGIDVSNEKLREQIAILESARKQYSETSAEYKYLSDQIAFHSTTIANSIKGIVGEGVGLAQFDEAAFRFEQNMKRMKEVALEVGQAVGSAFEGFTSSFVNSLGLAENGFQGFVKGLANTVTKLISMLLSNAIANAIAGATQSGTATGPAAIFTTPAFIATAVGGVLAAFASIPKFADGGIAYGPTLGLMGEYAGARNNPEVIAPLNKLKDLIAPGGGSFDIGLGTRIKGTDLEIIIERVVQRNARLR
ncbi:hypothetical protein [Terasakiella sp.]|uniref:hypothetical protein n=1 Tax=Terasakiella sp. TaxID=2034861 RepID=UPI003AA7AEC2